MVWLFTCFLAGNLSVKIAECGFTGCLIEDDSAPSGAEVRSHAPSPEIRSHCGMAPYKL